MINLKDIITAQERLRGLVLHTPLIYSQTLNRLAHREIFLKLENLQITGSFKLRGSLNKIKSLAAAGPVTGVVAASAGNHAQGVAYAAWQLGIPATIVMPQWASISKQLATEGYGGQVIRQGPDLATALAQAQELAQTGLTLIHPFDDPEIIAGQGTMGLEILEALPTLDSVVVAVGGGGLASGIAVALKESKPQVRVIGVQAAEVPAARAALDAGQPVSVAAASTLADGINVTRLGEHTFPLLQRYLDELVLVSEAQIAEALLLLLERKKVLAEGAGAVSVAALLGPLKDCDLGNQVVVVISGGNIDIPLVGRVLQWGLIHSQRCLILRVVLPDIPGALGTLSTLLGQLSANILHIYHDRRSPDLPLDQTRVQIDLETRGPKHCQQITEALTKAGYAVESK
ncbi:MAG: threonine ammonia-lyase [Desulfobacca sp. 4484_104]|nr:MAG: threonine ammonia-lyase [Desulfobacca sp. 4484_104]RLA90109.1 MAG: threonine ammonia-lyase [Deltaproteobacteria bacterium]